MSTEKDLVVIRNFKGNIEGFNKNNIYRDPVSDSFFCKSVTRVFGENLVVINGSETFISSVMPLNVNPNEFGLLLFGTLG